MLHKKLGKQELDAMQDMVAPAYGSRELAQPLPKYVIPEEGMPARLAYDIVHDELMLDGNSRLNLATFVTTWMDREARQLLAETFDKNMIDKDEYPQTAELEMRCVNMLARLYHAEEENQACGCSTVGSSEAAMLGGMALKWKWRRRMEAKGKPTDKPNMVMSIGVQVCWDKFCRYWEVEPRFVPMEPGRYVIDPAKAMELVDENTIGVVGIMGTTHTGLYEPIEALNNALEDLNARTGWEVPLHVDAASGGFVAPFLIPDTPWDFRLKWVKSINVSGHKYGLVYPGVGWVIWRDWEELPKDLIFDVNYLGGSMPTFALNFSRPGNQIVGQYYNFIRLGFEGYAKIHSACRDTAMFLAEGVVDTGMFELVSRGEDIPVFAFKMSQGAPCSVFDVSAKLRERGWLVPAYTLPDNVSDTAVLRVVVKEGFSRDMAGMLLEDLARAVKHFEGLTGHTPAKPAPGRSDHKIC